MATGNNFFDSIRAGDATGIATSLYDTVEFRTTFSMPIVTKTRTILQPGGDGSAKPAGAPWWLKMLKPTVVFSGAGGRQVIAPEGVAGDGTIPMWLALGSLVVLGFVLGRATK